jgi:Putative adhesin
VRHESFSTPGPVTLDIRIPAGDVEIETDDAIETAVELQARGRDAEELERDAEISMRPRGDGYEVRIEAGRGRSGLFGLRGGEYRVRVATPHGATVRANLASADISGRGRYAEIDVKVASGDVEFEDVSGAAGVNAASGDVRLDRVGTAKVNSASGDVKIDEATEGADVNTASGDVAIGSLVSGDVRLNSASGDIDVGIAKGSRLWVDAQTLSGDTSSELDLESDSTIETDEGPLVELKARSMSGDISVKRA